MIRPRGGKPDGKHRPAEVASHEASAYNGAGRGDRGISSDGVGADDQKRYATMDYSIYFLGHELFGDKMPENELTKWYSEEELGYYELVRDVSFKHTEYVYNYGALNERHGYKHIRNRHYRRAIALGCARGDDVAPISGYVDEYLAIEPAEQWWSPTIGGKPATFAKPNPLGDLPCGSGEIDLALCFAVLHHIPNVTHVINEISRVSAPGGRFLLREPISTMGDWRRPRVGLTKNERGFPIEWLDKTLVDAGFTFERRAFCMFPLTNMLGKRFGVRPYSKPNLVLFDEFASNLTKWNYHYHRNSWLKKIAPGCAFYILRKL